MNILFVNYGDFTTNSLNHIGGFAAGLASAGHACAVAVPAAKETISAIPHPAFAAVTYAEVLAAAGKVFPDGRTADILHAWTPREGVRRFVLAHQRLAPAARVVVHLEDNEDHLVEAFGGRPVAELRELPQQRFPYPQVDGLPHPVRFRQLLQLADGVTVIVPGLARFAAHPAPVHLLEPGVDAALFHPQPPDPALRRELGLRADEKVVVFTGSVTFANVAEMRDLYRAVHQLNGAGVPTRLVRTGFTLPDFAAGLGFDPGPTVLELGFVPKERLPALLALADVLVQPGRPGPFNDLRLPSKLPEFLAMGRPVVLPAANIGLEVQDGVEAVVLRSGSPEEIVAACRRVFGDPAWSAELGARGAAFARRRFDLARNSAGLGGFYRDVAARAPVADWSGLGSPLAEELPLVVATARRQLAHGMPPAETEARLADIERAARQLDADLAERAGALADLRRHAEGLEVTRSAREREIADLGVTLANVRAHAEALEQETQTLQRSIEEVRRHAAAHARELEAEVRRQHQLATRAIAKAREIGELAEQETTRLQDELRDSRHRVARMQATFSWRATAWLRWLRRTLVDPIAGPPAQPPLPPPAPRVVRLSPGDLSVLPPAPKFHCHLDAPRRWPAEEPQLTIRGWVVSGEAGPLRGVRARVGDRTYPGEYGLSRPDVGHAFKDIPGAEHSGFRLTAAIAAGDRKIELEAAAADSTWHVFFSQELGIDDDSAVRGTYAHWVREFDTVTPERLEHLRKRAARFGPGPLISILMPVYDAPERWLVRAIESVRAQVYPHWELCLANDASPAPHVRAVLDRFAAADARIRVVHRAANGHIAAASNSALELATGAFAALMDHDDELAPHALLCLAEAARANPDAVLVYSDEDKIDETGARFDPHFKPDWSPDLLEAQNYLSHLTMIRTTDLRAAGGFRVGFEGAQDWDLFLRVTERAAAGTIVHVPRVLYHWRAIDGSTATHLGEKDYAGKAGRRALEEHFARRGEQVDLDPVRGGHWRVRRKRPDPAPAVTLVIPTRNRRELLVTCVESILARTAYPNFSFLIADNDSDDPELAAFYRKMEARGRFRVLPCPGPFNFSAINNRAMQAAEGEIVGLLNNDLEAVHPDWLDEMVAHAVRPEIGCVGARLLYPDRRIQHAGVITGLGGVAGHPFKGFTCEEPGTPQFRPHVTQNLSAVTAACLLVRREVYLRVGGLDETGLAVAFNDVDFCLKVRALGLRNLYTPHAELLHHESASRGAEDSPEKVRRFQLEIETMRSRWGESLLRDPAYNPNLTLDSEDFGLAYPPRVEPLA